jgi:hypothetical protein
MFTGVIDSTELCSRGDSSSQAGYGSSSRSQRSVSSMEDAMREQQEKFCEELRKQQMAFLQQQSEYMAAYNAQAQQAMNVSVLFILNTLDIGSITNILYLQQSWFPQQAQQQPFVFPQFQSPMLSGDYMLHHLHLHHRFFNLVKTYHLYQPNFKSLLNLIL